MDEITIEDKVVIKKGVLWEGEVGIFKGVEETIVGTLCKIDLDNGFSSLQAYKNIKLLML